MYRCINLYIYIYVWIYTYMDKPLYVRMEIALYIHTLCPGSMTPWPRAAREPRDLCPRWPPTEGSFNGGFRAPLTGFSFGLIQGRFGVGIIIRGCRA